MRLIGAVVLALAFVATTGAGCGVSAVGVDDCRQIEQTRCDYAPVCGISNDVDACKRFYRDQCLHGLSGGQPSRLELNTCLDTIRAAGACAKQGKDTPLDSSSCVPDSQNGPMKACDVIASPELTVECAFLAEVPVQPYEGGDGNDAADTGSAGASGDAGSDAASE